jgi:hypothetical protein
MIALGAIGFHRFAIHPNAGKSEWAIHPASGKIEPSYFPRPSPTHKSHLPESTTFVLKDSRMLGFSSIVS